MRKAALIISAALLTFTFVLGGCGGDQPSSQSAGQTAAQSAGQTAAQSAGQTAAQSTGQTSSQGSGGTAAQTGITEEQAKAIALKDSGVAEADAVFTKVSRELDDGAEKYDIDFTSGGVQYEYDIDARTGEILAWAKEQTIQQTEVAQSSQTEGTNPAGITEQQALENALKAAGLTSDQITNPQVKLEFDDDYGRQVYDVEFRAGITEYNYDIDPENGNVLSSDIDADD